MKIRLAVLSVLLATTCGAGLAQDVTPSVAIGTHVLTIGMSEPKVLEALGTDLVLKYNDKDGSWMVMKQVGELYDYVGDVRFTDQRLTQISRMSIFSIADGRSGFDAIYDAAATLESQGMKHCRLSTNRTSMSGPQGGIISSKLINFDCGVKSISISVHDSQANNVDSNIEVTESLRVK